MDCWTSLEIMQPFDYSCYEYESDLCRRVGCVDGRQISLFPTPVFQYKLKDLSVCRKTVKLVEKSISDYPKQWTDYQDTSSKFIHNTLTSSDDLHLDPQFNFLLETLNPIIQLTIDTLNISTTGFNMLNMWSNINGIGGYLASHTHPNSFLSGVFYLQTPGENKGKIFFEDPKETKSMWQFDSHQGKTSMFQYRSWEFEPDVGDLFLFPSWLRHGTCQGKWKNNEYRMSLSFNILPKFKCTTNTMTYNLQEV